MISSNTQIANRYGLNFQLYKYSYDSTQNPPWQVDTLPCLTVDFVNVSEISIDGDKSWATGGRDAGKKIAFNNPIKGVFKISTQILTDELLKVISGTKQDASGSTIFFGNNPFNKAGKRYFKVEADTVWEDESGETYDEKIYIYKVVPTKAYNVSYNGDGEPISADIEFGILEDWMGRVLSSDKQDHIEAAIVGEAVIGSSRVIVVSATIGAGIVGTDCVA